MKKRFFSALLCLCLLAGLVPGMSPTAQAAGTAIGQTVEFAGHEWYIIGTDDEADGGVTAPEGCYTLFAKDNKFGSTTFRARMDQYDSGANIYKDSDLQQAMERIAQDDNYFPAEDRNNIVSRDTSDEYIAGDFPAGQLLWPISGSGGGGGHITYYLGEVTAIDPSLLKFETSYWTRSNWTQSNGLVGDKEKTYYHAITVSSDGGVVIDGLGQDIATASQVTETHAIRPALYVKQEAVTFVGTFQVGADVISKASVGDNLVENTGTDTPLVTDSDMSADVKVRLVDQNQSGENLAFRLFASCTTTGANQVVACVMTDSTGAVKYYGKLADCTGPLTNSFNISVPMTDVANGTYTLSIFAHNTAANTISTPSPTMTVTVSNGTGTVSNYVGEDYMDGGTVESIRFIQHPQNLPEVKTNETATFTAQAVTGSGNNEDIIYTWQVQGADGQGGWYTILDASTSQSYNNSSITFKNLTGTWAENGYSLEILHNPDDDYKISNGFHIRCQAKKSSSTGISEVATLTVDPAPAFTQNPQDQTVEAGGSAHFSAEAAGISEITYTWQAQPKTSNPELNMWYDIYDYVPNGVSLPYRGQTLYLPKVSGSWQDNEKILYDGSGYVYASTFDPAEARFRCVATDKSDRVAYSDPAELTVTGGTPTDPGPVTAIAGYGGSIDQTTFTATASSGFVIDQMWVDGAEITAASGQTSYTPANTPTDSVFVTFAYTVNFNTPAGGSLSVTRGGVTLTSGTIVRPGDELTITAAPDSGYTLDSLTVNGTSVTAANGVTTYTVGAQPTTTRTVGGVAVAAVGANITAAFTESGATPPTITGVTVTPATATVQQGNTRQFSASVTGTGDFSQAVTWTVEGAVSASTTISASGLLTVGADETAPTLTVRATASGDNTKSGVASVTVETAHAHNFGTEWKSDATSHWHECICGAKADTAAHVYTDDQDTTCNVCGFVRQIAPAEFTITFNANGGSVSLSSATTKGGRLESLPTPDRSDYNFLGWSTAASGGTRVTTSTVFTADATLYARWEEKQSSSGGGGGGGSEPSKPTGPSTDNNDGWTGIQEEIGGAEDGDTITVDMNGETEVPGEIFEEVAGKDVTVEFDMGGGVSWTVNGEDVPTNTDFSDLNLGVDMDTSGISVDVINTITGEYGAVQVSLDHDGEFGFALTLTAPLGRENAGYWANLYHYDEDAETLNYETSARIDEDGNTALRMTHASQYAIVIDDKSHDLPFTDVAQGAWYESAVRYVYTHGSMEGMSATTFAPNKSLTRAEAVQVLYNLVGQLTVSNSSTFPDLVHDWYKPAIAWAEQTGVVDGYEDGTFRPDQPVTRQEFAQMLYNYAKYKDYDLTAEGDLSTFPDGNKVQEWAVPAMSWANGNQLINGHDDGTLEPGGTATRAQAASILTRFDQNFTSK